MRNTSQIIYHIQKTLVLHSAVDTTVYSLLKLIVSTHCSELISSWKQLSIGAENVEHSMGLSQEQWRTKLAGIYRNYTLCQYLNFSSPFFSKMLNISNARICR